LLKASVKIACMIGLFVLATLLTFTLLHFKSNILVQNGMEVSTYLPGDQPYDRVGDPVCLAGIDEPIGRVKSVQRSHPDSIDWKVSMLLDGRYLSTTPSNAIVVRRWRGFGACKVAHGSRWDEQFAWRGRFLEIECPPVFMFWEQQTPSALDPNSAPPIKDHAVLAPAVDCCGGIAEMIPEAWSKRWCRRVVDFVEVDIGPIRVELAGVIVLVVGVPVTLIWLVLTKRRRVGTV
jgi:hypothetical protein